MTLTLAQKIAIWVVPVVLAITVHEVAHGWAALKLGDRTAQMMGRLTLNPIKHIDPVGTILVPGVLLLLGGLAMGWAKPVPVAVRNLGNPKRDMAWVALAGPAANLLMALGWGLVLRIGLAYYGSFARLVEPVLFMAAIGISINLVLLVLNLLPLPPLDGGRVLVGVLPERWATRVARLEPYGLLIVLALVVLGLLGRILWPPVVLLATWLTDLVGVHYATFHTILAVATN